MLDRLNLEKAEEARTVRLPDVCKEETAEDRKIVIRAGTEGGSFCITVDNTYSGTLHYTKGGVPASTKHKGAGLGTAPSEALPNAAAGSAAWRQGRDVLCLGLLPYRCALAPRINGGYTEIRQKSNARHCREKITEGSP